MRKLTKTEYLAEEEEKRYWDKLNKQAEDYGGDDSWRNESGEVKNTNTRNKDKVLEAQKKMREYIMAKQPEARRKKQLMFK